MKRGRSALEVCGFEGPLFHVNTQEIILGAAYLANAENIEDPLATLAVASTPTGEVRLLEDALLTDGAQTIEGPKYFPDGIQLGTDPTSTLNTYLFLQNTTLPTLDAGATFTTLTVRDVAAASVPWVLERFGRTVHLRIPRFRITDFVGGPPTRITFNTFIPAEFRPGAGNQRTVIEILDNVAPEFGIGLVNILGSVDITRLAAAAFTAAPNIIGLNDDFSLTWTVASP